MSRFRFAVCVYCRESQRPLALNSAWLIPMFLCNVMYKWQLTLHSFCISSSRTVFSQESPTVEVASFSGIWFVHLGPSRLKHLFFQTFSLQLLQAEQSMTSKWPSHGSRLLYNCLQLLHPPGVFSLPLSFSPIAPPYLLVSFLLSCLLLVSPPPLCV